MQKHTIVVITGKLSEKNRGIAKTASKLLKILVGLENHVICISTNPAIEIEKGAKSSSIKIFAKEVTNSPLKAFFYLLSYQIRVILMMLKVTRHKKIDIFIFCFGADLLILPILIARSLGKKVIIRSDGRPSILEEKFGRSKFKFLLYRITESVTYMLATLLVLEADHMLYFYNFKKYEQKVWNGSLYVNTTLFRKVKWIKERAYDIGYVGRFSADKGILEFIKSLHYLPKKVRVIIIGDGPLRTEVRDLLAFCNHSVDLIGWVKNEKLPEYYNNIKVSVLPSYKEGLPNALLEAMACGTPVLATPVGGIPSVIKDGKTGFIMENNSADCIAKNVIRALEHQDLERIVKNAGELVEKEYTYEAAVERYRKILENLGVKNHE